MNSGLAMAISSGQTRGMGDSLQSACDGELVIHLLAQSTGESMPKATRCMSWAAPGGRDCVHDGRLCSGHARPTGSGLAWLGGLCLASEAVHWIPSEWFVETCSWRSGGHRASGSPLQAHTCTVLLEYVYFARPDSSIDGLNGESRAAMGRAFREHPIGADVVIPFQFSTAALGCAEARE